MNEWKKVKIGDFLTEREGRYKPNDPKISKYRRLDKIDFSGEIHISDKPTKTDMILVQPGDLVISGINVAKGAITVYQGAEPICATIHYSAYTFDDSIVDLEFFEYFVKSPAFVETLKQQIKGGIKTEIKPKHLLPLEISIPNLNIQKQIVAELSKKLNAVKELSIQISKQKEYIKSLRANILQDAIEGKLTVDWRKQNPTIKGDCNFDAEALYEQIQNERSNLNNSNLKSKKSKFEPIAEDEKPFEIPNNWKWVRLEEITTTIGNKTNQIQTKEILKEGLVAVVSQGQDLIDGYSNETNKMITDLPLVMFGDHTRNVKYIDFPFVIGADGTKFLKPILVNPKYLFYLVQSVAQRMRNRGYARHYTLLKKFLLSIPPLKEQEEIVNKVETLLAKVATLENQIQDRKSLSDKLIFGIIKENLEGE